MAAPAFFDLAALISICGQWPQLAVPTGPTSDALLERLRQILGRMHAGSVGCGSDLMPLLRQALLRGASGSGSGRWARVPLTNGWPTRDEWIHGQFEVAENAGWVTLTPLLPRLGFLPNLHDLFDDAFLGICARQESWIRGDPLLKRCLHLDTYTGEGQREAVRALLHLPPTHTLVVNLPTGSGKSLMAQLPPLLSSEGSLTLVIVPTVALAIDQAARMRDHLTRRSPHLVLPPLAYHGGLEPNDRRAVYDALRSGAQPVLFTSPENATGSLRNFLEESAAQKRLDHVVIDEAHLVVGWGNGFRPAFQLLPALVRRMRHLAGDRPIRAVLASATLSASTTQTLRLLFGPIDKTYVVSAVHLRPEPRYAFHQCEDSDQRQRQVLEAVRLAPRPFILYVTRPDEASDWLQRLRQAGFRRVEKFSGATPSAEREKLLQLWSGNELDGMVATSAFGLGVDKNDVRTVIHATLPESLDRFYQEVGRGGRDGKASVSLLLFTQQDIEQAESLAGEKLIRDASGYERWTLMIDHAETDAHDRSLHWVDLNRLPPHLRVESEASALWNVRVLTLMARAGILELVALANRSVDRAGDTPLDFSFASHAAVRILEGGHRDAEMFARKMQQARDDIWTAAGRGFKAMLHVATLSLEVSEALAQTYSIANGPWSPVTRCCGGCPQHWLRRAETVLYQPPIAPRLRSFMRRDLSPLRRLQLPSAASNRLVVDVPNDRNYEVVCLSLVRALSSVVRPHTWTLTSAFADRISVRLERTLSELSDDRAFVDVVGPSDLYDWHGGEGEVRVVLWDSRATRPPPAELSLSVAQLDVLVVASDLVHPTHPGRRLIDTTPHVHASDLLKRIAA